MKIEVFNYNDIEELKSNTYIIYDDKNKALVFDPSVDYDGIIEYLEKNNLNLVGICLTHGHFDHMRGVKRLLKYKDVPLYIHPLDRENLTDPHKNCSDGYSDYPVIVEAKTVDVKDNQVLKILHGDDMKVIHTPYHTIGSVCYYFKNSNILISGDTLFKMTIGRSDLPTSTPEFRKSTFAKLLALPGETKVYPGHGSSTTIDAEVTLNRFLKRI